MKSFLVSLAQPEFWLEREAEEVPRLCASRARIVMTGDWAQTFDKLVFVWTRTKKDP